MIQKRYILKICGGIEQISQSGEMSKRIRAGTGKRTQISLCKNCVVKNALNAGLVGGEGGGGYGLLPLTYLMTYRVDHFT